jgi:DNA-binding SARP family transcriptional activator
MSDMVASSGLAALLKNVRNALLNLRKMTAEVDQLFHHRGSILLCQGTC